MRMVDELVIPTKPNSLSHYEYRVDINAYLGLKNKANELGCVDPMGSLQHAETAQNPPRVADILELLWSTVQSSILELSFAEPPPKLVSIDIMQCIQDGQCSETDIYLSSMALSSG